MDNSVIIAGAIAAGLLAVVAVLWLAQNAPGGGTQAGRTGEVNQVAAAGVGLAFLAILGIVSLALYLLPTFIAISRGHQNLAAIVALNLLTGWSFIGWVAALVWAFTEVRSRDHYHYHQHAPPGRRG
jgi:hypothetical protein